MTTTLPPLRTLMETRMEKNNHHIQFEIVCDNARLHRRSANCDDVSLRCSTISRQSSTKASTRWESVDQQKGPIHPRTSQTESILPTCPKRRESVDKYGLIRSQTVATTLPPCPKRRESVEVFAGFHLPDYSLALFAAQQRFAIGCKSESSVLLRTTPAGQTIHGNPPHTAPPRTSPPEPGP
jgi:hypothetical protein